MFSFRRLVFACLVVFVKAFRASGWGKAAVNIFINSCPVRSCVSFKGCRTSSSGSVCKSVILIHSSLFTVYPNTKSSTALQHHSTESRSRQNCSTAILSQFSTTFQGHILSGPNRFASSSKMSITYQRELY